MKKSRFNVRTIIFNTKSELSIKIGMTFCASFFLFSSAAAILCTSLVQMSVFVNLSAQNGAGISLDDSTCGISVDNCYFYNDYSTNNGGGMYINANSFNCTKCCFQVCKCGYFGSSIYTSGNLCKLHMVSSFGCSYISSSTTQARTICLTSSTEQFSNLNLSFNTAYLYASIMWTSGGTSCTGNYSTFFNNTEVVSGSSVDLQSAPNPYTFGMNNYVQNRPKATGGFIWRDNGNTVVVFNDCLFSDNGNYTYIVFGTASSTSPTFISCTFDISSSRISGATTQSCSFNQISQTLIYARLIEIGSCGEFISSNDFTGSLTICSATIMTLSSIITLLI